MSSVVEGTNKDTDWLRRERHGIRVGGEPRKKPVWRSVLHNQKLNKAYSIPEIMTVKDWFPQLLDAIPMQLSDNHFLISTAVGLTGCLRKASTQPGEG